MWIGFTLSWGWRTTTIGMSKALMRWQSVWTCCWSWIRSGSGAMSKIELLWNSRPSWLRLPSWRDLLGGVHSSYTLIGVCWDLERCWHNVMMKGRSLWWPMQVVRTMQWSHAIVHTRKNVWQQCGLLHTSGVTCLAHSLPLSLITSCSSGWWSPMSLHESLHSGLLFYGSMTSMWFIDLELQTLMLMGWIETHALARRIILELDGMARMMRRWCQISMHRPFCACWVWILVWRATLHLTLVKG
jgi:hypothetical protein